jgi:hypothetical protein
MSLEIILKNLTKQLDDAEYASDAMKVNAACDLYSCYIDNLAGDSSPAYRPPERRSVSYHIQDNISNALDSMAKEFEALADRAAEIAKKLPDPDAYDDSED